MSTTINIIEGIKNVTSEGVTKAQVGLGNVDNTADANKPISTATQTALNLKADTSTLNSQVWDYSQMPVGSVLQVAGSTFSSAANTTSTSYVSIAHSLSFTPKLSNSLLLVKLSANLSLSTSGTCGMLVSVFRDGVNLSTNPSGQAIMFYYYDGSNESNRHHQQHGEIYTSANSINASLFQVYFKVSHGSTTAKYHGDWGASVLTVMEIKQ